MVPSLEAAVRGDHVHMPSTEYVLRDCMQPLSVPSDGRRGGSLTSGVHTQKGETPPHKVLNQRARHTDLSVFSGQNRIYSLSKDTGTGVRIGPGAGHLALTTPTDHYQHNISPVD